MNILLITGLLWGCSALIFGLVMWRRPRTLWSGFTFFWLLVFTAIFMISIVFTYSGWISVHPFLFMILGILAILALFGLLLFPFLVILTFFVEGIQVIVKEGASWTNFLSLAFALGLIVYMIGFPLLAGGSAKIGRASCRERVSKSV